VVPITEIEGKVSAHIPYLGFLVSYGFSLYGIGITIMWIAIALLCGEVIRNDVKKDETEQEETGGAA
jgi:hypothetical protein